MRLDYVQRYAHRHKCAGASCTHAPPIGIPGDAGWLWTTCPVGLLYTGWWRLIVGLHEAAEIAPLSGWPDAYSMWAFDGLRAIRSRQADELARQLREAQEG